ncbi:ABC transporter ATP-binding protein [Actinokineospora diospyrosa]|uniref:ABC-2 type transport system ATP-binding protein n=1 Tax=Actinokineospora diospyrosa TaxID=103728 RepID=A0A8G1A5M0_9PSEU|nr:ABC transporter ATP-binding protein [Actinokineospora diospyrosa]MCP2271567.1 ABC-2 type transport system ATP-binding protein [Actinokineospora diospyrosa]QYZ85382.1 DisT [Actinokineospora diospyrosa]
MNAAFDVRDIVVRYGRRTAVDGVSLSAAPGTIVALLGPNGAGKSTLLRAVSTAVPPDEGRIEVFGHDVARDPVAARARIGVVFQERTLDPDLSVWRNLWFHARLFGLSRPRARARIDEVLERFGLADRREDTVAQLSGGLARRLEIARALVHRPGLVVLDEPTTGLDPDARRDVWADLRRLRDEHRVSVLYATHYLGEAELADHIAIIHNGVVVRRGSPAELKSGLAASALRLSTEDDASAARQLSSAGFDARVSVEGVSVRCARPESHVAEVVRAVSVAVREVAVVAPSLDDVYFATTEGSST